MISIDSVVKITETACECSASSVAGLVDFVKDIALLVVGAVLSHVAVWLSSRGKLKVYYANYIDKVFNTGACFMKGEPVPGIPPHTDFLLPIQLDFVNTSGRKHVFRAISAIAYSNGKATAKLNPLTRGRKTAVGAKEEIGEYVYYGIPQSSYSFTVPEHECIHTELLFIHQIDDDDLDKNKFDEVRLEWRDSKDKAHSVSVLKISDCWKRGTVDFTFDWTELK